MDFYDYCLESIKSWLEDVCKGATTAQQKAFEREARARIVRVGDLHDRAMAAAFARE